MDLFTELMAMPTGIFTVLLGLVILYWVLFLIGSLDLDVLGGVDGAADGALEGAAEASAEGAAEVAMDGGAEGAVEGATGLLHALKLRSVPATVAVSFFVFLGWISSYLALKLLGPALPDILAQLVVFVLAFAGGLFGASLAVRPFAKLFVDHKVTRLKDLVGRVVTITTGRVDERFGQASCDTSDSLILEVRAKKGSLLKRGDAGLLIDYDEDTRSFTVEPADALLVETRHLSSK
jgi:hypothetical protein